MSLILITRTGKSKYVDVPERTREVLCVVSVMFPPSTPVKLGKYTFRIDEINPWPPPKPMVQTNIF